MECLLQQICYGHSLEYLLSKCTEQNKYKQNIYNGPESRYKQSIYNAVVKGKAFIMLQCKAKYLQCSNEKQSCFNALDSERQSIYNALDRERQSIHNAPLKGKTITVLWPVKGKLFTMHWTVKSKLFTMLQWKAKYLQCSSERQSCLLRHVRESLDQMYQWTE